MPTSNPQCPGSNAGAIFFMPITYKRIAVGESQLEALRDAIEIRIIYLEHYEQVLHRRNEETAKQRCFESRCALVHFLDDLNEARWQ